MKLIKAPDDFLEKKVNDFDFTKMDAEKISAEMFDIMKKYEGVGLAANQVGIDAQIFIMGEDKPMSIINPLITEVSTNQVEMMEGCLSFPGLFMKVKRPDIVGVKYLDTQQKECIIKLEGFHARVFLHEYDHLQGITFDQRVSKMRLDMAKKKQEKILKGFING
jgi:peptide deformylase|tara:strand:+ start:1368 stop:1859 length:492 start_codon:yes stop_codon:yes gene_type:complete